ncbi:hypothetical protein RRG08_007060 [Elysia crispata]|uniref:Uncharacterized protein n=1 Tax=Elysia crispata TaxID=231223 RepID=A0AAE0Z9E9_9GAST|nr:hypothetical protein RRG08_007060 [Elysia crispata]
MLRSQSGLSRMSRQSFYIRVAVTYPEIQRYHSPVSTTLGRSRTFFFPRYALPSLVCFRRKSISSTAESSDWSAGGGNESERAREVHVCVEVALLLTVT